MPSRYHQKIDPEAVNSAHAMALELTGFNKRVLELGAASGHVTEVLVARHCDVVAVELEPESARELEGLAGRVLQGDLNDPGLLDGLEADFDVVLAGDVLEHLVAPDAVLRRAARLLVPGGRMVISLPHVAHADVRMALAQGRWEYRPWGLMDRTHLRFFTRASIEAMLTQAGLVPVEIKRVVIPAFESELAVARDSVPTELVDHVLADPEAETYQFVIAAVREDAEHHLRRAHERVTALESELARTSIAAAAARVERDALRAELLELRHAGAGPGGEPGEARDLDAELHAAQAESQELARRLRRVEGSVTWQAFQRVRGSVFDLAGGPDAAPVRGLQATLRWAGRRRASRGD